MPKLYDGPGWCYGRPGTGCWGRNARHHVMHPE